MTNNMTEMTEYDKKLVEKRWQNLSVLAQNFYKCKLISFKNFRAS